MRDYVAEHEWSIVAHHEAGHACVAVDLGLPFTRVSIQPREDLAGQTYLHREQWKDHEPSRLCIWLLAGPEAERHFFKAHKAHAARDYHGVRALISACYGEADVDRRAPLFEALARAKVVVHERWIANVAKQLVKVTRLDAEAVRSLRPEGDR